MGRLWVALVLAAGLAATPSCGPDFVYDNPCDPASADFDPCACASCFEATCQRQGDACGCSDPALRCGEGAEATCCAADQVCVGTTKACCTPVCDGRQCGDDGCGGSCGTCQAGAGYGCSAEGQCLFTACDGKECGDNGHGGSCGSCPDGSACSAGLCVAGS